MQFASMDSPRPKNLSKQEIEQYNLLLEEQAFPFEEKAIAAHVTNIARAPNSCHSHAKSKRANSGRAAVTTRWA